MKKQRITRREFVGLASASAFALTYVPSRAFGANERLNVASVGVGGKGAGEVRDVAAAGCDIVALCDVDSKYLAKASDRYKKEKTYRDSCRWQGKELGSPGCM